MLVNFENETKQRHDFDLFWSIKERNSGLNLLIFLKSLRIVTVFGQLRAYSGKKFWSGKWKAVPLRADYYQSNSLLGNAVWNLAVPHGVVRAIN